MESSEPAPDSPPRTTPGDAAAPRTVTLASAVDIAGFRAACRRLWAEQTEPARVVWRTAGDAEGDLFASPPAPPSRAGTAPPLHVPAGFLALCEDVIQHSDPGRFDLLYRLLWRLQHEPGLRDDVLDADRVAARQMAQAVRRDSGCRCKQAAARAAKRHAACPRCARRSSVAANARSASRPRGRCRAKARSARG